MLSPTSFKPPTLSVVDMLRALIHVCSLACHHQYPLPALHTIDFS